MRATLAMLLVLCAAPTVRGQVPDSAATAEAPPAPTRPPRLPFLDAASYLGEARTAWVYDFGTPGWPDGWSPYGIDPGHVGVTLGDIPWDDPVTGRPAYELLPYDKLASLGRAGLVGAQPEGMRAELAEFLSLRPVTEMVYRSTSTGLQQVSVVHAQTRRAGQAGTIQYLFGFAGGGARGEYEGSRLRRKRQVLFRVQRKGSGFTWELGEMFNRHRVGAHGGVEPVPGFDYASIFVRLGATTSQPDARRQLSRNDLWLKAGLPRLGTSVQAYWTVSTLTHRLALDTTAARVSRVGMHLRQPLLSGRLELRLDGHSDSYPDRSGWGSQPAGSRSQATAALGGRHRLGGGSISWSAGALAFDPGASDADGALISSLEPVFSADLEWETGVVRPFVHSRNGVSLPTASDVWGFSGSMVSPGYAILGRQAVDEIGVSVRPGWLHVQLSVAASRTTRGAIRLLDESADTLLVAAYPGLRTRTMATGRLGLREFSRRGAYAWAEATGSLYAGDKDGDAATALLDDRLEQAVPELFGKAAIGIRGILFRGDLDGDFSLRARGWTAHRGLRFHAESGLLALPALEARAIEQSVIFDLVAIAHIRAATLTVSLENFLSGTVMTPGNQLIPDYPYPERRLRFSVFWPIFD